MLLVRRYSAVKNFPVRKRAHPELAEGGTGAMLLVRPYSAVEDFPLWKRGTGGGFAASAHLNRLIMDTENPLQFPFARGESTASQRVPFAASGGTSANPYRLIGCGSDIECSCFGLPLWKRARPELAKGGTGAGFAMTKRRRSQHEKNCGNNHRKSPSIPLFQRGKCFIVTCAFCSQRWHISESVQVGPPRSVERRPTAPTSTTHPSWPGSW